MDGSALRNVFGSSASLAELSGDSVPQTQDRTGYSRFGLNEHPPAHQMHIKVRRASLIGKGDRPQIATRRRHWYVSVPVLLIFGVVQSLLMHVHLPRAVVPTERQQLELLVAGSLLVVLAGYIVPSTDKPAAETSAAAAPTATSSNRNWKTDLFRSYGALLGLIYLTERLPRDAVLAWVLIAPSLWYIADATLNGFLVAVLVSLAGSAVTFYEFPEQLESSCPDALVAIAGTATAYFGTSLVAGNVGRGLRKSQP